jgi:pilus assembly protein CpaF
MSTPEKTDIKARIHHYLISRTNFLEIKDTLDENQLRAFVDQAISNLCQDAKIQISFDERASFIRELVSAITSLGPIRTLVEDPNITEIMINGAKQIYIQKKGHIEKASIQFQDNGALVHMVHKMLAASGSSRRVDESSPYVDFSMNDGSRVNVILPPLSLNGPIITIRKFSRELASIDDRKRVLK